MTGNAAKAGSFLGGLFGRRREAGPPPAPGTAGRGPRLVLRTVRPSAAAGPGRHASPLRGTGLLVADLREYAPGDDVRSVHWAATARSGRTYVKTYEEERHLTVFVALDVSASVVRGGGGGPSGRPGRAVTLAAAVVDAAAHSRDRVGACLFTSEPVAFAPPSASARPARALLASARELNEGVPAGGPSAPTDLAALFSSLAARLPRTTLVVVVSDFVSPPFDRELRTLAASHDVVCACPDDGAPRGVPGSGLVRYEDAESGEVVLVDAAEAFRTAAAAEEERLDAVSRRVSAAGAAFVRLQGEPVAGLAAFMDRRAARRGRR